MQRLLLPLWQTAHLVRLHSGTSLPCQKICVNVLSKGMKEACRQNSVLSFSSLSKSNPLLAFHQNFSRNIFSREYFTLKSVPPGIFPRTVRSRLSACRSGLLCNKSTVASHWQKRNKTVMLYVIAGAVLVVGFSYAAVPLYTVFCQATGLGGEVQVGVDSDKVETMNPVKGRQLVIRFNADTAASMRWNFKPQQTEIKVFPGETALAFYSAINPTEKPIIGISTYNVVPFDAGQYFNKIQCFCFEEQRLNPHEQVDMPVFFYIDPEFAEDPKMEKVDTITLSYTFFEAKEGLVLPDTLAKG